MIDRLCITQALATVVGALVLHLTGNVPLTGWVVGSIYWLIMATGYLR